MYILECADGSYYTGSTIDLERRLWQHQNGLGANHTARRLPVTLVYCEWFDRVSDAFYREKQVQRWTRRRKEALIAGDSNGLHELAVCQNESRCDLRDSALLVDSSIVETHDQLSCLGRIKDSDCEVRKKTVPALNSSSE
jgi:putative endonuclease